MIGSTLQSDDTRIAECITLFISSDCCEYRQIYSSLLFIITTSHDQFTRFIILETKCTTIELNRSQFRQIYSSFPLQSIHSQIPHENTHGMHNNQTGVISNWASLFIILSSIQPLSNTAREQSLNALRPNRSDFKLGKSIHQFIHSHSLFNSNEAYLKLQPSPFNSPISITSKESTFSISHME